MSIEDIFVEKGRKRARLEEFLMENLKGAGYGGADVRRTPTGTRITLYVERPGVAIGRSGRAIHDLTDELADKLGIENPQIEVSEIDTPEFNASVMAERVAFLLSRGIYFRRAGYSTLRRIMDAGARGAEIVISGKLTGNYAREERFYDGYLKKAGERASRLVSTGHAVAKLPVGTIGVKVRIMPPGISILDESGILKEELEEAVEESDEEIEEKSKEIRR
ncbi:30S ribosomal protein S3 [candidate division MSBL1 archaeon SCGC-AAA261F19]|uniref:Small ribosomal subunit protein uS3 n=2 Tax=candidate division MSBL1 TaxID=215777 RepID=A0A133VBG2_9EURY|nr:30S ribosomal protein S3 [candidate division MSBL1 archaeon SCGC-AAA261D19]KXB03791.1 30S ribosomal protein S3 [candidate division MSBL1 archaeon SCGC-AAA261F19]